MTCRDIQEELGEAHVPEPDGRLSEGSRIGRFVILHDVDGSVHAVAAGSVAAICETEDGSLLMLPGGRMLRVPRPLLTVLAWLDGRCSS